MGSRRDSTLLRSAVGGERSLLRPEPREELPLPRSKDLLALEERFLLREHERVRPPLAARGVGDRQAMSIENAVNMRTPVLRERPREDRLSRVSEERTE